MPSVRTLSSKGRFKRSLLGYRAREVDEAIADVEGALHAAGNELATGRRRIEERDVELAARGADLERSARRIAELEQVSARLAGRVVDRERELRELRAELERARERGDAGLRALAALAEDLDGVRRQARGQATRMRLRALRQAAELTQSSAELARRPGETTERLLASIEEAIERIEDADEEVDLAEAAGSNGHALRTPGEVFEGLVEVEVGPLSDFSQLVGFEDAASGIGATSEVSVKRFSQGRATLSMRFKHPVELLRELEERSPFEFVVRDTRSDRIVLDVEE